MIKRIALFSSILALVLGGSMAPMASPASAQSGFQYCYKGSACLNAWNGGPAIKVYSPGVVDNDFTLDLDPNWSSPTAVSFQDTDGGPCHGCCIGDSGNNSSDASAGLVACWSPQYPGTGGWGSNFAIILGVCPSGEVAFYNFHWAGYLGPPSNYGNGSEWYLNKPTPYCFANEPAVG